MFARRTLRLVLIAAVVVQAAILGVVMAVPAGALAAPPLTRSEAMARLPLVDSFAGDESPLSRGGGWRPLSWASSPGEIYHNAWVPLEPSPQVSGAFWVGTSFVDRGAGLAVSTRIRATPAAIGRYLSLWLDMPFPGSVKTGYELRLTHTIFDKYDVEIWRWHDGTKTRLTFLWDLELKPSSFVGLADDGAKLTFWARPEGGIAEWGEYLTVDDTIYDRGYAGLEGVGRGVRLKPFRAGLLPALAP